MVLFEINYCTEGLNRIFSIWSSSSSIIKDQLQWKVFNTEIIYTAIT